MKQIYLARNGIKPIIKGQAIMRHGTDSGDNIDYPIAFIRKSTFATEEEYQEVLNFLFKV